jgi:WD40 repeat protein
MLCLRIMILATEQIVPHHRSYRPPATSHTSDYNNLLDAFHFWIRSAMRRWPQENDDQNNPLLKKGRDTWKRLYRILRKELCGVQVFKADKKSIVSVGLAPDCAQIASCSEDQTIRVWDVQKGSNIVLGHSSLAGSFVNLSISP